MGSPATTSRGYGKAWTGPGARLEVCSLKPKGAQKLPDQPSTNAGKPKVTEADDLRLAANELADAMDADILIYNYEVMSPHDFYFLGHLTGRKNRRKNVILFLVTEGGSADSGYRMMRALQSAYARVSVVVAGWCKSAGTLMCIGAHELYMGYLAELGPLDVQIVKADEMDEQKSGLVAEAAFEKLQQEAYKFFMSFVRDIGGSEYRVTLKTAFDVATKMTIGVVSPIFDKLEPVTMGEDYRSNRLAQAYAERLNLKSECLRRSRNFDALHNLLTSYPAHGFAIDAVEAGKLFRSVKPFDEKIVRVVEALGPDAMFPRNRRQDQQPRLEFLNVAQHAPDKDAKAAPEASAQPTRRRRRDRTKDLSGDTREGSEAQPAGNATNGQTSGAVA